MKTLLLTSILTLAGAGFTGTITCSTGNDTPIIQINEDHKTGYIDAYETCILLQCASKDYGLSCLGNYNDFSFSVNIDHSGPGLITQKYGENGSDSSLSVFCEESN